MATSTFRNKSIIRPKKSGSAKRQRLKNQKKRVLAFGVSEAKVRKMTPKDIRELLKRPKKIQADN